MSGILERTYSGNTLEAWLIAFAIAALSFVALKILQRIILLRLSAVVHKTETILDDLFLEIVKRTRLLSLVILALYLGSQILAFSPQRERVIDTVMVLVLLLQGSIWATSGVTFWVNSVVRRRSDDAATATSLSALGFFGKLLLWSITALLILENLGVNITALVAGLGIGGIAVALALQNVLSDLFASLSIVLDKPFVIGDFVIVDDYLGTVEHVGLKTTRVRSLSGEQVIFSNADLLKSRIRNFKRMFERRVVFTIGVTYDTGYEKLAHISSMLKKIVEAQSQTRFDRAHFKEYGESALVFEVVYFVRSPDYNTFMDIQQAINLEIYRRCEAEGIEFAFPTRTLNIGSSQDSSNDGNDARSRMKAGRRSGKR